MKKISEMTPNEIRYCLDLTRHDNTGHKRFLIRDFLELGLGYRKPWDNGRGEVTDAMFVEIKDDADRLAIAREVIDSEEAETLAYDKQSQIIDHCLYNTEYPQRDPHKRHQQALMFFVTILRNEWMTAREAEVLNAGGSCAQALGLV